MWVFVLFKKKSTGYDSTTATEKNTATVLMQFRLSECPFLYIIYLVI
jgi:hypothetical protein